MAEPELTLSRYYRPELDALRFCAFLLVFSFHLLDYVPIDPVRSPFLVHFATIGAFGVSVFFLLSAFLITELLLKELAETSRIHVKAFYLRRILRIWPLYFAAFYGLAVLAHFLPEVGPTTRGSWLAFSFFAGNWYVTRYGWIAGPVDPLWSISVEEQFYILIPLVIAAGKRAGLAIISGVFLFVSYVVIWSYAYHPSPGDSGEWTNSLVQFQFFAAGTLIALALRGRLPRFPIIFRLIGVPLALGCWFLALLRFGVKSWDAHPTESGAILGWLLVLAGCMLFFLAVLGIDGKYVAGWLAYLGRISYGLYVFHSLIFHLVFVNSAGLLTRISGAFGWSALLRNLSGLALVLTGTILAAHLSYRFFETPFLRIKQHFSFIQSRDAQTLFSKGHARDEGAA